MSPGRRTSSRLILCLGIASLVLPACRRDRDAAPSAPAAQVPVPAPAAAPAVNPQPTAPAADERIAGTVVETVDSGGYTYAKIDRGGSQVWAAGPATKLAVGDRVEALNGTLMTGFRSATLDRTFDRIYFVSSFTGASGAASGNPHASGAAAPAAPAQPVEKIAPVQGGTAVADLFAKRAQLAGKSVAVRGKVVKVNNGIMGRNWVHLHDGSGAAGTNDLLVTTSDTVRVGEVVVARGTLATDKDFGSGYRYDLVVEDAKLAAD